MTPPPETPRFFGLPPGPTPCAPTVNATNPGNGAVHFSAGFQSQCPGVELRVYRATG